MDLHETACLRTPTDRGNAVLVEIENTSRLPREADAWESGEHDAAKGRAAPEDVRDPEGRSSPAAEEIFCKFCYSFENPLGKNNDLVNPCGCKGSIKYVHKYCLRIWRFKGKSLKDIKSCEQCFCEYRIDDEHRASRIVITVSTLLFMAIVLLAANIVLNSTVDTVAFIAEDIGRLVDCRCKRGADFSSMGVKEAFACQTARTTSFVNDLIRSNMDRLIGEMRRAPEAASLYMGVKERGSPLAFLEKDTQNIFLTFITLSLFYQIAFDLHVNLLINFFFSLWRLLIFASRFDVAIFSSINLYVYLKMYRMSREYVDNLYTYVLNFS